MRIAIFCTNEYSLPPKNNSLYAPLWIASQITERLVERGHQVTFFASSDSKTKAKLISENLISLKRNKKLKPYLNIELVVFYEQILVSKLYQMAQKGKFDIIHIHPYRRGLPYAALLTEIPTVFTIHEPISPPKKFMFSQYKNCPQIYYVSLSEAQRKPMRDLNYAENIYNGIEIKKYRFNNKPDDCFVIAGRIVPEKGIHLAIKVAKIAGVKLIIAGAIAKSQKEYWEKQVKPHLSKDIKYVGNIPYLKMSSFYRKAKAFLFPIQWEEPFGLVMTEAMACGTPVIAFRRGSVSEVVKHGKTGFIVPPLNKNKKPNIEGLVEAIKKIDQIDR